jgi:hypothetical protein
MANEKVSKWRWVAGAIICFVLLIFWQNVQGEESMLQGRPVFKLEINAYGLSYYANINGVTVMREFDPRNQISIDVPINHWMHPGQSEFTFHVLPEEGENFFDGAFMKVALIIEDKNDKNVRFRLPLLMFDSKQLKAGTEMAESLAAGSYHLAADNRVQHEDGEIELSAINKVVVDADEYDGALTYSRMATIPNSLPLWSFFSGDTLPDYYAMSDEDYDAAIEDLFIEYKKVQDALASGDIDSIMPMFAERNREGDQAFYYEKGGLENILREGMLDDINDPDWKLKIRTPKDVGLTFEDNHKLVSLTRGEDSNAIGFVNSNGAYNSYPMMFRKQDGKWVLTR